MRTGFRVDNIRCAGCAVNIDRALRRIEGVKDIDTDVEGKRVTVEHDERISAAEIVEFLREIGFDPAPAET